MGPCRDGGRPAVNVMFEGAVQCRTVRISEWQLDQVITQVENRVNKGGLRQYAVAGRAKKKKTSGNNALPDVFRRGENSIYYTKSADAGQIL